MDVEIDLGKSLEENASEYFEKSKLAKRKLSGLRKAMLLLEEKASKAGEKKPAKSLLMKRKRQWFEAFHWFRSSDGFIVVGGRDAKSNEVIVKRHLMPGDIFLHADIQGGSACVVKADGKKVPASTLGEAAEFAAVRSKAWKLRHPSVDVYAVENTQVSKAAPAGEAITTGSFMIYGKRQWFRKTPLNFAVGISEENGPVVVGGPPSAVKGDSLVSVGISFGGSKKSDTAKQLLAIFRRKCPEKQVSLDEILNALPGEGLSIREQF